MDLEQVTGNGVAQSLDLRNVPMGRVGPTRRDRVVHRLEQYPAPLEPGQNAAPLGQQVDDIFLYSVNWRYKSMDRSEMRIRAVQFSG
jgi:hypothetical protein